MKVPLFDLRVDHAETRTHLFSNFEKVLNHGKLFSGPEIVEFESKIAKLCKSKYAIGVSSGSSALYLALKASGIKNGDEVITTPLTWIITVNAIVACGAIPVFADVKEDFNIDPASIEKLITKNTKAIVPVHFTGYMTYMPKLMKISKKYKIPIIEDACQSILGEINKKKAGTWGLFGAFSLHPLKNINVWSDGGIITTNNYKFYKKLLLLRNHGLIDRDTVKINGFNSRLDTFQAVVGNWLLPEAKNIAQQRIKNAKFYDENLSMIKEISIPPRPANYKIVYHLYIVFAKNRDKLLKYCRNKGIEAKVHYPKPMYLQESQRYLKHKRGDFPVTDAHTKKIITFPCDQHLKIKELKYVVDTVQKFYKNN